MIGISEYAYELGSNVRSVEEIAAFCSKEEVKKMRNIGLDMIPTDNDRLLSDMIQCTYQKISEKPECIIIAHSLPFINVNNRKNMTDPSIQTFFLSGMPCAIMHKAVDIAVHMIQDGIYKRVLVIGADKSYSDRERVFWGTIMGDGVVALLISVNASTNIILSSFVSTTIYAADGENSAEKDIMEFRSKNALMMRNAINNCMTAANIEKVDYFVTHTSNRLFWDALSELCKIPRNKFLDGNIKNTGHMNSHDSFYHYLFFCSQGTIKPGDTVMLINPGFGGTQGCTIIQR